jgi:hypothetical protein
VVVLVRMRCARWWCDDSGSTPKPNQTKAAGPAEKIGKLGPHAAQESWDSADEVAPAALGPNDSAPSPRRGRVDVYWLLASAFEESAQL